VVAYGHIPKSLQSQDEDEAAPRYQINFRGLAAYGALDEAMKSDIRRMIDDSKNALFNHHPRPECLDMVRQMLPLLNGHASATAWFGGSDCGSLEQALSSGSGGGGGAEAGDEAKGKAKAKRKGKGKAKVAITSIS
jgi:hypothetical protein